MACRTFNPAHERSTKLWNRLLAVANVGLEFRRAPSALGGASLAVRESYRGFAFYSIFSLQITGTGQPAVRMGSLELAFGRREASQSTSSILSAGGTDDSAELEAALDWRFPILSLPRSSHYFPPLRHIAIRHNHR